ncbi:hypothetical protein D8I24_4225 [Cupriavidus necator H850]|nr:hypothetical protein D8I24_4225 [Cupriavidus necator H850]
MVTASDIGPRRTGTLTSLDSRPDSARTACALLSKRDSRRKQ